MKLDELPFDFVRRRVSVSVEDVRHGDKSLICKGAVEEMLMVATHLREGDRVVALDETAAILLPKRRITTPRVSACCWSRPASWMTPP